VRARERERENERERVIERERERENEIILSERMKMNSIDDNSAEGGRIKGRG
jgi:hypothetical protein